MSAKMIVSYAELDDNLAWLLETYGVSKQWSARDTMRVLCNNLIQMTFPQKLREGKQAIDSDTDKIFGALDSPEALGYFNSNFGDGTYTKGGKLKGKKRQSKATRNMQGLKFNWSGDQSAMQTWHQDRRNGKGKVNRQSGQYKVGPWHFSRSMYVTKSAMRKYRKTVYKSIGKVKAGWVKGADYFGAKTKGRVAVPAFVRKQELKRGSYLDAFTEDGNGFATVSNLIPYASRMTKFFLQSAIMRTNVYQSRATKKQIDKIVARFNASNGKAPSVKVIK